MGFFKQIKDMKQTVAAAPEMIEQAQQMQANAQQMQAQQAAAAQQASQQEAAGATGPDYEPISGVSLEQFADVSKGLAAVNYDQSQAPAIAATKGISGESWQAAVDGWNVRIKANPAVAKRFNALYMGRA
ncbi:MAG: hypothetical protein ACJ76P_09610 [Actinomycetota bacterium]